MTDERTLRRRRARQALGYALAELDGVEAVEPAPAPPPRPAQEQAIENLMVDVGVEVAREGALPPLRWVLERLEQLLPGPRYQVSAVTRHNVVKVTVTDRTAQRRWTGESYYDASGTRTAVHRETEAWITP